MRPYYDDGTYRRPACQGSTHVIPVPLGMDADAAWAEMTTLGRLAPYEGEPTWATIECQGGERCACRGILAGPNYRRWHNDRLVEARIFGIRVPRFVIAVINGVKDDNRRG